MNNKESFLEILKALRSQQCAYSFAGHQADRCDCKFHRIGEQLSHGETSNGCPELSVIIERFEAMSDLQWTRFRAKPRKPKVSDASDKTN